MSPAELLIKPVDPQGEDAMALLREAAIEAGALYPEFLTLGAPGPTNPPNPPRGIYLVAYVHGAARACGALRPIDQRTVEIRRMSVREPARRQGLARAMLIALEQEAERLGYEFMRLETGSRQRPAMALYQSCGFGRIAPFGAYGDGPLSVCFEKRVAGIALNPSTRN